MTTPSPSALVGLSEEEAAARREQGLGNSMPPATSRTYWHIVRDNVFTFINAVLFLLGTALVMVGRPTDAIISVGIISINILVSVVQEIRAKRILDRVALLARPTATVLRDRRERAVGPEELVKGDLIRVRAGDQILVDGQVIEGGMEVDESQLTGESNHISKKIGDSVYSGSYCSAGGAVFEAQKVGSTSYANQLTASARTFRKVLTPLQGEINLVIRLILVLVVYLELLLAASAALDGLPFGQGVAQATVVAGLVPNGLLLAIAVAYALGAVRIVRLGALVQQSNAIESLSNVDVLCLDKTGTLTTNHLRVDGVQAIGIDENELRDVLGAIASSSTAPNRTTEAITVAYPAPARMPVAEVPFSSDRRWSATAFDDTEFRGVYALGAPEVLQMVLGEAPGDGERAWEEIASRVREWMTDGLRVLLVAFHPEPSELTVGADDTRLPMGMIPIGLLRLSDELRPEASEALASFSRNGVKPKIISGDHPETVAALAAQAGLSRDIRLVSGLDLAQMDQAEFGDAAATATVFGRITPQQKEQLIEALRDRGHYVAMIGDGVNDVLSLKKANLGIAMQSGSQATRGVADIVLMNDSFAALGPAVAEGQRIVNGMQDILKLFMARIASMALLILSAQIIGIFPINLRHASLINLCTVGIPTVLLAVWARPGYRYRSSLVSRLAHFVIPAAVASSLLGLLVFYGPIVYVAVKAGSRSGPELALGIESGQTTLASFLVVVGLLLVIFVEPPTAWWAGGDVLSGDRRPTLLAAILFVAFVAVMATPLTRGFFELQPLDPADVLLVTAAALVWTVTVRAAWRHRLLERFVGAV